MKYHAFISYNSKNRELVRTIYDYLSNSGLRVFFDDTSIKPGDAFQEKMQGALRESASILVMIGPDGVGPWQEEESYEFQILKVRKDGDRTVIPVLLPGASFGPEVKEIPFFLNRFNAFSFGSSVDDKNNLFRLMRAIPRSHLEIGPIERPFLRDEQERLLDRTIDFYNKEANRYFERWKASLPRAPMYAFLEKLKCPPSKPRILDAGCGPGHHSNFFALQGCEVEGIDASAEMIRIAEQNKTEGVKFQIADMRDLQRVFCGRNIFDGVWACASCFHITKEALGNQLYEFLAVLKPAGVLAISMQVGVPSAIQDDGRFFERYEEDELQQKLTRYGFHIANINTDITDRNTLEIRQVKKWMNITALAPEAKDRIEILDERNKTDG